MQFIYNANASENTIFLQKDAFLHIFKSRRTKEEIGSIFYFRNLKDDFLYKYALENKSKKDASFTLIDKEKKIVQNEKYLHIGWCIIDPKEIEKNIVILNELGVTKITFIYCNKSQANYAINTKRIHKILINSSQQCGRSNLMQIDILDSLEKFKEKNPDSYMLNFSEEYLDDNSDIKTIVIGCEGGFSDMEQELFKGKVVGLRSKSIFKSSSVAVALSSKLLLN